MKKIHLSEFLFAILLLAAGFAQAQPGGQAAELEMPVPRVNINTADAPTLALALDGVGVAKAQDIVEHRELHGEFKSVEALAEVKGIGPATIERNRERIQIADKPTE